MIKLINLAVGIAAVAALAGCANPPPISADLGQDAGAVAKSILPKPGALLEQGLRDAQWNLHQAVTVGALAADDPAAGCLDALLPLDGATPAPSFVPRVSDLVSAGSVAYIRLRQAEHAAGGGVSIPMACKAVIGQVVIDALQAGKQATALGALPLIP